MNTPDEKQRELAQLQDELATRSSTLYFAKTAVSLVVAVIVGSAAGKLYWDSAKIPYLAFLATAIALGLAAYGAGCYLRGKRALKVELEKFERLQGLRRALGLDDPGTLLPSR